MALSQELPDCDLEVRTDTSCTSPEEVLQSGVDALIQILLEPVSDAIDCLPLFDTKCHLLASPGSPLSACGTLTPDQLAGQTICFESCDAVFVSMLRRCMEDIPLRWLMVPDFEKEYVRMLAGKCLFLSPVRSHGYPPEWFHPLSFPFPPAPTCLFTRKDDTRPCLQVLRQLTLAEHRRAVADDSIIRRHETRNGVTGLTKECIGYENGVLGGVLSALTSYAAPGDYVFNGEWV